MSARTYSTIIEDIHRLKAEARRALEVEHPIGSDLEWVHSCRDVHGTVVDYSGHNSLRVQSHTGKIYWIDTYQIRRRP